MFDISPLELLTIALIALIVFGPHRLPDLARKAGEYIREIRRAASELTAGLDQEVRDLKEPFEGLKEDLTKPVNELKQSLDDTAKGIQEPLKGVGKELGKPLSAGGPAEVGEPPKARWVGAQPETGVAPDDAWRGMDDPVPPGAEGTLVEPAADATEDVTGGPDGDGGAEPSVAEKEAEEE